MNQSPVTLSLIQHQAVSDPQKNLQTVHKLIEKAANEGGNIICLQELCSTLYFCNKVDQKNFALAEKIPGPVLDPFKMLAEKHRVVILVPLFEKAAPGVYYNTMAVIDADGAFLGKYRKLHIPEDPGFHEKYYFTPGDLGYKVFDTAYAKIGTLICWDQWYPEAARITAMKGADLLVYPTAIGTLPEEFDDDKKRFHDAWKTIQKSHAVANGCYVASINRVGEESGTSFWGQSFVAGPFGEILAEGGEDEEIIHSEINPESIEGHRQTWPFFRDRRIDTYKKITKKYLD